MDWRTLPPLTALRAFAAAAEHESLTRAAEALNVTHSAVSQQIRALEVRLGTRLIQRTKYGITLTSQGAFLANRLLGAFAEISEAAEAVGAVEAARPLLVSVTPMFAAAFLVPRMAGFIAAHPEIELNLDSTIEAVALTPGGVDLAIRYGTGDWAGLETEPLLPGCLTVVAATALVRDRVFRDPAEIFGFPVLQEQASVEFDQWLDKVGVPRAARRKVVRLPGNMLLDGIRRGEGIGATVPAFIADELKACSLRALFDDPIPGIGYHLVTRPGPKRPALRAFIDWLKATVTAEERALFRWPPVPA